MVEGNFVPGGPAKYQIKDTGTALALAAQLGLRPAGRRTGRPAVPEPRRPWRRRPRSQRASFVERCANGMNARRSDEPRIPEHCGRTACDRNYQSKPEEDHETHSLRGLLAGRRDARRERRLGPDELTLSTPDPDTSEITVAANKFAELVAAEDQRRGDAQGVPERHALWRRSVGGGEAACRRLARHAAALHLALRQLQPEIHGDLDPLSVRRQRAAARLSRRAIWARSCSPISTASASRASASGPGRSARSPTPSCRSRQPEDLAGLKLRVPNNPLWVEFFGKLGAVPTPMAFAEVYNALQLKVVDGQENPISVPVSAKFFEVQSYASITNHIADGWVLGINPAKYDALTDAQKAAITEAAERDRGLEGGERRRGRRRSHRRDREERRGGERAHRRSSRRPSSRSRRSCSRSSPDWSGSGLLRQDAGRVGKQ